jgi:penicillin-binding protein 2
MNPLAGRRDSVLQSVAGSWRLPAIVLLVLTLLMPLGAGCGSVEADPTPTVQPSPTPNLPPADEVAFAFLQAWEQGNYAAMYSLLSQAAQAEASEEEFIATYRQVAEEAMLLGIRAQILASYQPSTQAQVSFGVVFQTAFLGEFEVQNQMALTYEGERWRVNWSTALILPQLSDESFLLMTTWAPSRGNIYDRNGRGLAVQGELVELGVVPGEIEDEWTLLARLSAVLGTPTADLQERYAGARPNWYVPLGQITPQVAEANYAVLSTTPGVEMRAAWTRSYREGLVAPHVVGVMGPIPSEEIDQWREQGYTGDEMVGWMGLERWGEPYLAGERGGRLEIVGQDGQVVAILAEKPSRESSSLYTTFDRDFQMTVQEILGTQLGAIVVLEADTGRVLAMATYPRFDPNLFAAGISGGEWESLQADQRRPLVNRATQGTYPPGSVFKIVTMAAGMEAGGLTAGSTFLCRGTWTGLGPQWPKTCWLRSGHGTIPLNKALTVSCDITFYQVGLMLNGVGHEVLPGYAQSFGLGALTGIEVEEDAGLVPDPEWKIQTKGEGWAPGDTVNLAIGQGELLVSPLQIATILAAVGNGGTLYRPQTVEMIASEPGSPEWAFQPVAVAQIPVSAENLSVIQDSLHKVTAASYGTAYSAFQGLEIPVAGKTGTAESGQENPHAWFAAYAPAQDPEIAVVAVVEHTGEGSSFAAPLVRKVVEAYFGIQPEPTPTVEPTPSP